jgi:hypothetical protein
MPWTEPPANSNELRRCIRNPVALSALPAGWQNSDMRQIGGSIAGRLFEPFVSSKYDRMGLGLSISIIDALDGQLIAEPNPRGGGNRVSL